MPSAHRVARIRFPCGFHSRPMSEFIRRARTFEAGVKVSYLGDREPTDDRPLDGLDGKHVKGREVDGTSIFGLMSLEGFARQGDRLRIAADGPDAEDAVEALTRYVETSLDHAEAARLWDLRERVVSLREEIDRILDRDREPDDAEEELRTLMRMGRESLDHLERLLDRGS